MKIWQATYNNHLIRVEGSWFTGERLFVDGELQDEQIGYLTRSRLYGTIRNEGATDERVKVSLGGWFTLGCRIFVSDRIVFSGN